MRRPGEQSPGLPSTHRNARWRRPEFNVFVEERGARVTGEMQTEFVRLC